MKITKEEYEQYLELQEKIERQVDQIVKAKILSGFDNICEVNSKGIEIKYEYHTGCGDGETDYHDISLEELMMDYDDLVIEHERQEKEKKEQLEIKQKAEKERQLKLQKERDLARYNELKIKLNK